MSVLFSWRAAGLQGLPIVIAGVGGTYFGLFSCGGYAWHRYAFFGVLAAVSIGAAVARPGRSLLNRILWLLPIGPVFLLTQAAAAPFYPAAPGSLGAYLPLFVQALEHGPC